jgi:hypothetical protein
MHRLFFVLIGFALGAMETLGDNRALALPDPADIPEEVLRTEVITEVRSPLTGEPLSAAAYAALQDQLRDPNTEAVVSPEIAQLIQLLQFRRLLRPILPFLP